MRRACLALLIICLAAGWSSHALGSGEIACLRTDGAEGCAKARLLDDPTSVLAVGSTVYVGSFSGNVAGAPLLLVRRQGDGSLREVACWTSGKGLPCRNATPIAPNGLAVSPDGRNLYVATGSDDAHENFSMRRISVFRRDRSSGMVAALPGRAACAAEAADSDPSRCARVRGVGRPSGVVVAPDGRSVDLSGTGGVAVFGRSSSDGSLRQLPGGAACVSVALTTARCGAGWPTNFDGADALANGRAGTVVVLVSRWRREQRTVLLRVYRRLLSGSLIATGTCFASAPVPRCVFLRALRNDVGALTTSPDGRDVYVASLRMLLTFRASSSGALRLAQVLPIAHLPCRCSFYTSYSEPHLAAGASSVAVGVNGRLLVMRRAPASGRLSLRACFVPARRAPKGCSSAPGTSGLEAVGASADGRYVYAGGQYDTGAMGPTGELYVSDLAVLPGPR